MIINEKNITRAIIKEATEELLDNLEVDVAIAGGGPWNVTFREKSCRDDFRKIKKENVTTNKHELIQVKTN